MHRGTTHTLKNYVDQVLNRAINYYNGALSTAYSRIANLETEVTCLWGELIRLLGGNIASITNGYLLFVIGVLILQRVQKCEVRQVTKDVVKSEV